MIKLSTPATRAAKRRFWGSPAVTAVGTFLDAVGHAVGRYSHAASAIGVCVLVLVIIPVFGTMQDFPSPLPHVASTQNAVDKPVVSFHPCSGESDGDTWCYWNAEERSNGQGISFIVLNDPDHYYVTGSNPNTVIPTIAPAPVVTPAPVAIETPVAAPVEAPIPVASTRVLTPIKPLPTITVTGIAVEPVKAPVTTPKPVASPTAPVATPTPSQAPCNGLKPGDGGTTQQHNCATPTPRVSCPPLLHKDGVNISPPNAPKECVYAQ